MAELPSDEDLYPHLVKLKHKGNPWGVGLKVVKWLESNHIMTNVDFILLVNFDDERVAVRFKKKKSADLFAENKKAIRNEA